MSYRIKVTLLALGAVLGLLGGIRHFTYVHDHHHDRCGEQNQAQP